MNIIDLLSFVVPVILMAKLFVVKGLASQLKTATYAILSLLGFISRFAGANQNLVFIYITILIVVVSVQIINQKGGDIEND